MEEAGSRVAPPVFVHRTVSSPARRKRDLFYPEKPPPEPPSWIPSSWDWDCARFVAKPTESDILRRRTDFRADLSGDNLNLAKKAAREEEDERLELNLGGGLNSAEESLPAPPPPVPQAVASSRLSKRIRSGCPGGGSYPVCQVDNCKEDLSSAKDYHRRHKVCEVHSKASKALVGKQMQRFCQQCSRFHLLSEFDEGKRSCRRRLAGHNRRRRKTQQEDVTPQLVLQENHENASSKGLDLVNLLTVLAHAQAKGKSEDKSIGSSSVPNGDHLARILDLASKLHNFGSLTRKAQEQHLWNHNDETKATSASTKDMLMVLSSSRVASSSDAPPVMLSERSSEREETKSTSVDQAAAGNSQKANIDTRSCLELQLFTSSPENECSPPKLESSQKYFSSGGSNPMEDQSPSSSPVMRRLFPMHSATRAVTSENDANVEDRRNSGLCLQLFSGSDRGDRNGFVQSFPNQPGRPSPSGSDNSPSSSSSDVQGRTGRIIFKLFDKDPSHLPGSLRTQIYNWLSKSPLEMESHIRPGCLVLSIYVSMPSAAWNQLEGNLLQLVNSLVQDSSNPEFWRMSRFLVNTGRQLASYQGGKTRLCKSWTSRNSPELISVFPLAILPGQATTLLLRGRNLINNNTRFHCAYMGSYTSLEVSASRSDGTLYEEIRLHSFNVQRARPGFMGRCFIEVENGFKGASFPLILTDATICRELTQLEREFQVFDVVSEDNSHVSSRPKSKENVLHFLNELGWLFQKNSHFSLSRFRFLLTHSVERDCIALVKTLLDMLVERNRDSDGLSRGALETLTEIQLLNRAVKRKCAKMTEMLIHYSVDSARETSKRYIFPPNSASPGGLTPLHLAASTSGSEEIIHILTNDPPQIGLSSWNSLLDANGRSPYSYAVMSNNHSYNSLVARKLADRDSGQVSMIIATETDHRPPATTTRHIAQFKRSCETCAGLSRKYGMKTIPGSRGLFLRAGPYIHPILAVAAVCVCVCLFMRALPRFGHHKHFAWERLECGTI